MPTGNYSHMDGEMKHMVDGDGVGDDGGDEAPRILSPGEKSRSLLTPKTKIVVVAALCFSSRALLWRASVFALYEEVRERPRGKRGTDGKKGEEARPQHLAAPLTPFWASSGPWAPSGAQSSCFSIKITLVEVPLENSCIKHHRETFTKNSVRFSSFYSS